MTPLITEIRPNLRAEVTLAVNIPSPKPESMLNLSGAITQVNSNNTLVNQCQHRGGQHALLKPELVLGPKQNQQNQLARLVTSLKGLHFPHPSMILILAQTMSQLVNIHTQNLKSMTKTGRGQDLPD